MERGGPRAAQDPHASPPVPLTLAAAALAAVDDGQHHRLHRATGAGQAEDADGAGGVQAVAAALAQRLQVRLLRSGTVTGLRAPRDPRHHEGGTPLVPGAAPGSPRG